MGFLLPEWDSSLLSEVRSRPTDHCPGPRSSLPVERTLEPLFCLLIRVLGTSSHMDRHTYVHTTSHTYTHRHLTTHSHKGNVSTSTLLCNVNTRTLVITHGHTHICAHTPVHTMKHGHTRRPFPRTLTSLPRDPGLYRDPEPVGFHHRGDPGRDAPPSYPWPPTLGRVLRFYLTVPSSLRFYRSVPSPRTFLHPCLSSGDERGPRVSSSATPVSLQEPDWVRLSRQGVPVPKHCGSIRVLG